MCQVYRKVEDLGRDERPENVREMQNRNVVIAGLAGSRGHSLPRFFTTVMLRSSCHRFLNNKSVSRDSNVVRGKPTNLPLIRFEM